jgi:hypothetical protein
MSKDQLLLVAVLLSGIGLGVIGGAMVATRPRRVPGIVAVVCALATVVITLALLIS